MGTDDHKPEDGVESEDGIGLELARSTLGELVLRANYSGDRIPLTRHGKQVAYIVGPRDFERLKQMDNAAA